MRGPKPTRISAGQVTQIDSLSNNLRVSIPLEFARKPRSLRELDRWKATEFRQILLYYGAIVFKDILPKAIYDHFMCLSVAIRILLSGELVLEHGYYAHDLLLQFVENSKVIYSDMFLVYNVHSLIHLYDEAKQFGTLENISAFCFENYLQVLKKLVRTSNAPLIQISKRLLELGQMKPQEMTMPKKVVKTTYPNNCYKLGNGKFCMVYSVNGESISCEVFNNPSHLYLYPCDSRILGIYQVDKRRHHQKITNISMLHEKVVILPINEHKYAIFPFLH